MLKSQAHRNVLGRFVLGLFLFAWVSATAQPCLMAMQAGDTMEVASEHASHAGHHDARAADVGDHDCDHCPPGSHGSGESCTDGLNADCGAVPEMSAESRLSTQKVKDAPIALALPAPTPGSVEPVSIPPPATAARSLLKFRTAPSVCIRNCVFLK